MFGSWISVGISSSLAVACGVVTVPALIAFLPAAAVTRFRFPFPTTLSIMIPVACPVPVEALALAFSPPSEEAVYIGGASRARFPWRILFRLVLPGPAVADVFSFFSVRNVLLLAKSFIISDTSKPDEPDRGGVMAASTVMTIPVLVFLVLVQRRLVSGLGGAVKD